MIIFWTAVFLVSLFAVVKGADWLIDNAERIGLGLGISPFIVGVTIIAAGTSFPELVSSLAAVLSGVNEIVVANAVGSNIANILLVVGLTAIIGRNISVTKNLINLDLPLLAGSTVLFLGIVADGQVVLGESLILLAAFVVYVLYTIFYKDKDAVAEGRKLLDGIPEKQKIEPRTIVFLLLGILALVLGAKYLIDSLVRLSELLRIGTDVIAVTAVALGTSLPELLVSIKAVMEKKAEVVLGNIFGSSVFNILVVVGIPGLLGTLSIDAKTLTIAVPTMIAATVLFVISGISRRIHMWEGAFFLFIYVLFIAKMFGWF